MCLLRAVYINTCDVFGVFPLDDVVRLFDCLCLCFVVVSFVLCALCLSVCAFANMVAFACLGVVKAWYWLCVLLCCCC